VLGPALWKPPLGWWVGRVGKPKHHRLDCLGLVRETSLRYGSRMSSEAQAHLLLRGHTLAQFRVGKEERVCIQVPCSSLLLSQLEEGVREAKGEMQGILYSYRSPPPPPPEAAM